MRTYDLSPLFRSSIGFDRVNSLMDAALKTEQSNSGYPPYNIERLSEDDYRITVAVSGFTKDELTVVAQDRTLLISGQRVPDETAEQTEYLYRGIAERAFERRFQLADHIEIKGADLANGLLHVTLQREVPEERKPRSIDISTSDTAGDKAKKLQSSVKMSVN